VRGPSAQRRLPLLLSVLLGGVLVHSLLRFGTKALMYLRSPYSRDPGEGIVLAIVQLLEERGNYFLDMDGYPFVHLNYPPVFPVLVWPFFHAFGPSLFVPRLLSIVATLGILGMVYGLVRTLTGARPLAIAAAGVALTPWFLQTWAPTARVDMLAIFFSLAGLLAFARGARLPVVFVLFWLGFFTKQNALLAPAAVLLSLAGPGRMRAFALAAAGFAVPLAALFAGLDVASDGNAYRHLVTYTAAADLHWEGVAPAYRALALASGPLVAIVLAAMARHPREVTDRPARPLFIYWVLSIASLVTVAKEGSARNYLIEPWLATVLLAAVALPIATRGRASAPSLAAGALLVAAAAGHYVGYHGVPLAIGRPDQADSFRRLWEVVRDTEGPILSDNLAPLVLHRKPVLVEPFGLMVLKRANLVRTRTVVADCEAHAFALVVVEGPLDQVPGLGDCLATRYQVAESIPPYRLLRPKPSPSTGLNGS
jgi:hypothetical protein